MKKLMTLLGVMAFALGAFADNISGVNFDNVTSLGKLSSNTGDNPTMTPGTTGSTTYWYSAAEDLDASVTAYDGQPGKRTVASEQGNNVNYLKVESAPYTAPLYRSITANTQDGDFEARSIGDGLYIDTLVQFTVGSDSAQELDSAAKLALWVGTSEDTENAPTNIFVRAGYISESGLVATNYAFNVPANFSPENWYRVTVKAINNIVSDGTYVGFVVFVDGVALEPGANAISDDPLTLAPAVSKFSGKIFPSMINSGDLKQTLSAVGFSGTGAVDDLAFTATAPFDDAMDQVAFRLEWDTHVATLGVTIGGVPQAVDVEDLSKVFLYNIGDTVSISIGYDTGYTSEYGAGREFTDIPSVITITSYAPGAAYWNGSAWENVADINAALVAVGSSGGTIKLLAAETQLSDVFNVNAGAGVVVLDLAGKTLLGAADTQVVGVESGTLIITNSTPEVGKILAYDRDFAGSEGDEGSILIGDGASLKVYGGLIDGIVYGDMQSSFEDGAFQIFGGTFYAYDMDSDDDDFVYAPYVAEGYYATPAYDSEANAWFVTVAEGAPTPETFVIRIVKSDTTTKDYTSVADAVEALASGDTLVLLADSSDNIEIPDGVAITFVEGDYTFSGKFDGVGTVAMTNAPKAYAYTGDANGGTLFAETWAGTFQVAWNPGNIRFVLDDFGKVDSTVEIVGVNGAFGAFPFSAWVNGGAPTVVTKVAIADGTTWTVSNGNTTLSHITTIPLLTGGGNLVVNGGTGSTDRNIYYTITSLSGYTGTLSGSRCNFKIGNVVYDGEPTFGDCLVKVGANFGPYDLSATTVNNSAAQLAVGTVEDQKGVYLARAAVNGTGYVTVAEALAGAETACANTVAVLDGTSDEYPGWTLDNGVYTYASSRAYIGETGYPTLAAAVAAAGENEVTIRLVDHINEAVTVPANVTVEVVDDVQIRGGTLSGAGRFVYTKVPSQFRFTFNNWTGTVTLEYADIVSGGDLANQIVAYGNAGSVVEIGPNGTVSGTSYLGSDLATTLKVSGYVSIDDGSSYTKRTFPRITGDGVLVFGTSGGRVNYAVDQLVDWNGVLTNSSTSAFVTNIVSGTGTVVYTAFPEAAGAPTIGSGYTGDVVLAFNANTKAIQYYGGANSTIVLTNISGSNAYLPEVVKIPSKVRIAEGGSVSLNNGWPLGANISNWNDNRVVTMPRLKVDGSLSFGYTQAKEWTGYAYFYAGVLDASGSGSIVIGNKFALRVDAVDFAEAPSGTDALVDLTLTGDTIGLLYGPNGVAGEQIPVTTNGVATGQSLVYDAAKGGLVLYVEPSPSPAIDPDQGTTVDVDTTKSEEDQRTEAEAAAAAMDVAKTTAAASVDQAAWNGYFTKTVEKVDDKWVATAALNPAAVLPVDDTVEEAKLTDMLESIADAALDDEKTTASVPTKRGLYYWIAGATEVDATTYTYTPDTAVLGDGSKKPLTLPTLQGEDGKAFYKVCVGLEDPDAE